jgi:LCP family protein required for cell wall assembly
MSATTPPRGGASGRASVPGAGPTGSSRTTGRAQVPGAARDSSRTGPAGEGEGGPGGSGGPGGPGGSGAPGIAEPGRRGPRPRWGRIGLVAGVVLALLIGGAFLYVHSLDSRIDRTDPFSQLTGGRPVKTVEGTLNILLVGSDSRDPDTPVDQASRWRADTIILVHIPSDHGKAYLVSIPRDLYVPVPEDAGADCGNRRAKINAAFAWGGLPLAVHTVECFTDVHIDHVMAVDFGGFKEVTDALGGVDLNIEQTITSIHKPHRKFKKGLNHLNGAEALDYVRQRKQFPDGDFARMRHQQQFLRALMDKAASTGTLVNPAKLNAFLRSVTDAVTVDKGFSLVDMAVQFHGLRGENLRFLTSPHNGSQNINGESVVVSDRENALAMYRAITADKMAEWVRANVRPAATSGG